MIQSNTAELISEVSFCNLEATMISDLLTYKCSIATDFIEDWFSSPLTAAISFIQVLVKSRKTATFMPMLNLVNEVVSQ